MLCGLPGLPTSVHLEADSLRIKEELCVHMVSQVRQRPVLTRVVS